MNLLPAALSAALVLAAQEPAPYERWTTLETFEFLHLQVDPPRAVTASDGRVQCFGLETKQKLWETAIEGRRPTSRPDFHVIGGMWIVAWEPCLIRLNPATGQLIWKIDAEPVVLDARGFVVGEWTEGYHIRVPERVIDPATGKDRWRMPKIPAGAEWGRPGWSDLVLAVARSNDGTRLSLFGTQDGKEAWAREVKGRKGDLRDGACTARRALVDFYAPDCSGGPSKERSHDPKAGDPPCIRHELVDLVDGRAIWESATGGRYHQVGHHGEPLPREFSSDYGGTVAVCGTRIASYDLKTSKLTVLGPVKPEVELEIVLKDAVTVSARDLPFNGIRVKTRGGRFGWREGFHDFVSGRWTWVDLKSQDGKVRWVDRERALVDIESPDDDSAARLGLVRFGDKGMERIWRVDYTRVSVSGGWQLNDPIIDVEGGELVLYDFPGNETTAVQVLDLATGALKFRDEVPHHGGNFWIRKEGRYIVLPGDKGYEILRRR